MKRLLCLSATALCCSAAFSQVSFNNTVETGIIMPLSGSSGSFTRNGNGIHIGNHLDLSVGNGCFNWGIGAYIGHAGSLEADSKYKEEGIALARKYQLAPSQLSFSSTPFQSTQFLLGPVIGAGSGNFNMRLWAKGGFGINQAGNYAVTYREGNIEQKVYTTGSGENKSGLAYDLGAGFSYLLSRQLGFQVSASYNSTKTDMVNYSADREKGTSPSYQASKNTFVKASVGLVFRLRSSSLTPRDAASGLATDRRMHKPFVVRKDMDAREAGSGMATGRRMHQPIIVRADADDDEEAYETREAGSGMATGKRMHKPFVIRIDADDDEEAYETREAGSGIATGKRMHKPFVIRIDADDDEEAYETREAGSGMATGKRMHKPFVVRIGDDDDANVNETREAGSGMATGRRQYQPIVIRISDEDASANVIQNNPLYEKNDSPGVNPLFGDSNNAKVTSPRDAASGLATGKRMHKPIVITKELGKVIITGKDNDHLTITIETAVTDNLLYKENGAKGNNPLYEDKGTSGQNPLSQQIVKPGNGKSISEQGVKRTADNQADKSISEQGVKRTVDGQAGKSISEQGVKRTADNQAGKSINEKGIKRSEENAPDAAAKGINEAGVKRADAEATIDLIITQNGQEYRVKVKYPRHRRVEVLKSN